MAEKWDSLEQNSSSNSTMIISTLTAQAARKTKMKHANIYFNALILEDCKIFNKEFLQQCLS